MNIRNYEAPPYMTLSNVTLQIRIKVYFQNDFIYDTSVPNNTFHFVYCEVSWNNKLKFQQHEY
jgi:hypothetical protein